MLLCFANHVTSMEDQDSEDYEKFVMLGQEDHSSSLYQAILTEDDEAFSNILSMWDLLDQETKNEMLQYISPSSGENPLTLAVSRSIVVTTDEGPRDSMFLNFIEHLIDMGADLLALNHNKATAIDIAFKAKCEYIVELFITKKSSNQLQQAIVKRDEEFFDSITKDWGTWNEAARDNLFKICPFIRETALTLAVKLALNETCENIEQSIFYRFIGKLLDMGMNPEQINGGGYDSVFMIFSKANLPIINLFFLKCPTLKPKVREEMKQFEEGLSDTIPVERLQFIIALQELLDNDDQDNTDEKKSD